MYESGECMKKIESMKKLLETRKLIASILVNKMPKNESLKIRIRQLTVKINRLNRKYRLIGPVNFKSVRVNRSGKIVVS